jgi:hypothetical protein
MNKGDSNKVIAKFMGFNADEFEKRAKNGLKYHSNWDWLIPVVNLCKERQIFGSQHLINKIDNVLTCDCELDKLYEVTVEFINWHNENS